MSKTWVEITYDLRQDPIKAGQVGYVDGYVTGGDGSPYAVVVVDNSFYLVATHGLKALFTPPNEKPWTQSDNDSMTDIHRAGVIDHNAPWRGR